MKDLLEIIFYVGQGILIGTGAVVWIMLILAYFFGSIKVTTGL